MKKKLILILCVISALLLCSCGSSSDTAQAVGNGVYKSESAPSYEGDGYYEEAYEESDVARDNSGNAKQEQFDDSARKLIKTYNLSLETETFDYFISSLENEIAYFHGYIQNLDTYNGNMYDSFSTKARNSQMTVRIPASNVDDFVNFIGNAANITNQSLSVEDVTLQYVDTESRKKSYEIEQERLLEYLSNAVTMEEILTIENRLSEVRYMLESMESQLRSYDNLVDYATVYLRITEVIHYTEPEVVPVTYGERLLKSFTDSVKRVFEGLKNFLVGFVGALPALVVFAVVVIAIVFIIKGLVKANNKKNAKKAAKRVEEMKQLAEANRQENMEK